MPTGVIHLLSGPVGSGKSTYARRFEAERRGVVFSLDEMLISFFGHEMPRDLYVAREAQVMRWQLKTACDVGRTGANVVLDWGFWRREARLRTRAELGALGLESVVLFFDAPFEVRLERVLARPREDAGRQVHYELTAEMVRQFDASFEPPWPDEGAIHLF